MAKTANAVNVPEVSTGPSTPPSGQMKIYAKTDGKLYYKNDAGAEIGPLEVPPGADVYVQQAQPVMTTPGVWFELNPDGSLKTIWTGTT